MPHLVLDIVAKNPQEQHVACQMHPSAVKEHRTDQCPKPVARCDPYRDRRIAKEERVERARIVEQAYIAEENADIGRQQQVSHIWDTSRRVMIADWKHARTVGRRAPGVKRRADAVTASVPFSS